MQRLGIPVGMEHSENKFASELRDGHLQDDKYTVEDDIIHWVPESTLKDKTMRVVHASLLAVHPDDCHIYSQVRERFYGEGLEGVMPGNEMKYMTFQQNKSRHDCSAGLL